VGRGFPDAGGMQVNGLETLLFFLSRRERKFLDLPT
jgi:hypothetical protein